MLFTTAVHCHPAPRPDAVITEKGAHWRICVLSTSLIRIEWSADGVFEDNPTQTVVCRNFGATPAYQVRQEADRLIVETTSFRLTYDKGPLSREGLSVFVKTVGGNYTMWHYGDSSQHGNLGGTARTLDECDGFTPLGTGLVSLDGWAVLDDSHSGELVEQKTVRGRANPFRTWVRPRAHTEQDLYVFAHGHDYASAVADLYRLTGPTPLLPRYALGNWWSRYYPYTQQEYEDLQKGFKQAGIPFSVGVLDMDWHRVGDVDPKYGPGWTGYSWNKKLIPNPSQFLADLHRLGLHVTLNVHPRDGIRAFEDDYPTVARHMGIDPASGNPVSFDIADPLFDSAYFDMHHRLEQQGVDFWWIDWQQGGVSRQKGLDPLWMLNHLHYLDSARQGRWPLILSRYAGIGSHRYPIGFSGDSVISWKSLQFQPYFTATASNVGYGWWSHDIGGHMLGVHDNTLETRWFWLGVFSPINRLHSSASEFLNKDPRVFPEPYRSAMIHALRLRHQMVPYLYTMNWRAHRDGRPLVEPMYWDNPDCHGAYFVPSEYMFGSQMLVSPVVSPQATSLPAGPASVWLPQGDWFDFFDGRHYASPSAEGRYLTAWRSLDRIPAFVQAGGIIPLQTVEQGENVNSVANPSHLRIVVFPGHDGKFSLIEDDGIYSPDDAQIHTATTDMAMDWQHREFTLHAVTGFAHVIPGDRTYAVVFRGVANPLKNGATDGVASVTISGQKREVPAHYDASTLSCEVDLGHVASDHVATIRIPNMQQAGNPCVTDAVALLQKADVPYLTKELLASQIRSSKHLAASALDGLESDPAHEQVVPAFTMRGLTASHVPSDLASALREILLRD
jgi:alpha-glucosidase (family GH31 glycosyl hydrolase)